MNTDYQLGRISWHRPFRSASASDQRPRGAYQTVFVGKSRTARHVRLSVDDLLTISEDVAKTLRLLLAEGEE